MTAQDSVARRRPPVADMLRGLAMLLTIALVGLAAVLALAALHERESREVLPWVGGLLIGSVLILCAISMATMRLRRLSERRIAAFVEQLRAISEEQDDNYLPRTGRDDALDRMAGGINLMIAQLAQSKFALTQQEYSVEHEINSQLSGIEHAAVTLKRLVSRREDGQSGEEQAAAQSILDSCERTRRLAKAVMELARTQEGVLQFGPFDLARPVGEWADVTFEGYELNDDERDAILDIVPTPIIGNAAVLGLVARNLIENACKYTDRGDPVRIECRPEGHGALLIVEDGGPGIPEDQRSAIFSRGSRIEATEERPGHGYGLAIVEAAVRRHGGVITVETSPTLGGALFRVVLPTRPGA